MAHGMTQHRTPRPHRHTDLTPFLRSAARSALDAVVGVAVSCIWLIAVVPIARARRFLLRRRGIRPAVLWGPIPIINIHYSTRAERLFGYRSKSLVFHVFNITSRQRFDYALDRLRRVRVVGRLVPYAAFVWAGLRFDVFGFFFDGGLLNATPWWRFELILLKLAGTEIVVYPYGGDARLASETRRLGQWHAFTEFLPGEEDRDESAIRARRDAFGRHASVMLGCADIAEDLPRLDGIFRYPVDTAEWRVSPPEVDDGIVTIVHAPNHRRYKGTRFLIDAVERLRAEGVPVELTLVEGVVSEEARRIYAEADIIADQFLIGAYAVFAIEGMALGRPVVCYLNNRFRRFHPEWEECPIVSASPPELRSQLARLAADIELRRELGRRGPLYVERYHSLESVGRDMDAIYRRLWAS
jgi:glycosyltransferase involved in cell wall biosynthesis